MARFINQLIAEFKGDRAELKHADVPELGDGARIYWHPAWTLGERSDVYAQHAGRESGPELFVDVLIAKALDKDGEALFAPAERRELMAEVRPAIIQRIANLILADLNGPTVEDVGKN